MYWKTGGIPVRRPLVGYPPLPPPFDAMSVLITGIRSSGVAEDRQETPGFQDSSFGQNASNSSLGQNASNSSLGQNASNSETPLWFVGITFEDRSNDGRESGPLPGNNSISGASSQDQIKDPGSESGRDTGASLARRLLALTSSLLWLSVCQVLPRFVKKRPASRTLRLARMLPILRFARTLPTLSDP